MRIPAIIATGAMLFSVTAALSADVVPASLFTNGMVLERGMKCPVWGTAEPGEDISVTLAGKTFRTQADEKGDWKLLLDAMDAGGPFELVVAGKNTVRIADVFFGEVWLCSGQSNMYLTVREAMDSDKEIAAADFPRIRFFVVGSCEKDAPQRNASGRWVVCSPQTVPWVSAVGYFFGREVHQRLGVPVGLIMSSVGGTCAEAWTPRTAFERDAGLKPILDRYLDRQAKLDEAKKIYDDALAGWRAAVDEAKVEGKPEPAKPARPPEPPWVPTPGILYNGMIHPLAPYGLRGALWYQGESNAGREVEYRKLLAGLIRAWRARWGLGDFPFGIVQLANYYAVQEQPSDGYWTRIREAQAFVAREVPNCGLACAIDIGDAKDIHPRNKQEVGRRLALWALATQYGQQMEYSGPVFEAMKVEGSKIRLTFTHVGAGLVAKGGAPLKGFAIAGADGKFVWGDATIEGGTVVVSSDKVAEPKAVHYAWAENPVCNLYNRDGLPAFPFRTDAPP